MLSEKCSEVKLCTLEGDGRLRVLKCTQPLSLRVSQKMPRVRGAFFVK